jgi:hypothetical protein
MRAVACAVPLLVLLSVGCTPPGGDGGVEYPDSVGRDPTAAEVCGKRRAWPDKTVFVTAEHVIRRFREETGWALGRFKSIGIKGARTVLEVESDVHAYDAYKDHFESFQLDVIDPKCPALMRWLSAVGKPGPGGLVWEKRPTYGGDFCWTGAKRYSGSNLVVTWQQDSCKRGVNKRWKRLDVVLKRIVGD